ncbi:MAG TPA: pyridoxamine 5'-phosphate oxidase family protein [Paralcaligenes sp.]
MGEIIVLKPPTLPGWTATASPFHSSELTIQERVGVRTRIDISARRAGIRDYMPDQHRLFFSERPFLLLGAVDADGQPWPTIMVGKPGFVTTPDARTLHIAATLLPGCPLQGQLRVGTSLGTLGIQFATGRRNRANGVLTAVQPTGLTLAVRQSYGNCRKYIQAREPTLLGIGNTAATPAVLDTGRLSDADRNLISRADTFFIASACFDEHNPIAQGADVSHRGGRPGFIRIDDDDTLTIPDFTGNFFFNTLGNLLHDPRAGLLFIDFESADLLYVSADAHIIWDGPQVNAFLGAQRLVQFHLRKIRRVANVLPISWSPVHYSDKLAGTGIWQDLLGAGL